LALKKASLVLRAIQMTWKKGAVVAKPYRKTYPKPIPAGQNAKRFFVLRFVQGSPRGVDE
jgi:hypothetical protein